MDILFTHFESNLDTYKQAGTLALRTVVGTVLVGLLLCGIYFLYFLIGIYRLPRQSR
jgi:hypothetical protein